MIVTRIRFSPCSSSHCRGISWLYYDSGGYLGSGTYIPILPLEGDPIVLVIEARAPIAELPKDNLGPDIQGDYIDQVALCTGRDSYICLTISTVCLERIERGRRTLKLLVISRPLLPDQVVEIAREILDLGPVELAVFREHLCVECDRALDFWCRLRAMLVSDLGVSELVCCDVGRRTS